MYAAIDVGSNTVRLLIGHVQNEKLSPQHYERRITRLKGGMKTREGLAQDARVRTLSALKGFAATCQTKGIEHIRAVATAALRQASNGPSFQKLVQDETGLPLEIISGDEEALLTTQGVLAALDPLPHAVLIIDVGGGSTEFILHSQGKTIWMTSIPLGVVALIEQSQNKKARLLQIKKALLGAFTDLLAACRAIKISPSDLVLVGTAGTVTTLAALELKMVDYDWNRINNFALGQSRILNLYYKLLPLSIQKRENLPGMEAGRGDLIIAGIEIILCTMDMLGFDKLVVSDFGILEGCLLSLHERMSHLGCD